MNEETWINNKWRPMMAWVYMSICIFDFLVAPVLWSLIQALFSGSISQQWVPITLQGGGLIHAAMGGIVGITAWSRGKEKLDEGLKALREKQ